MQPRMVFNSGLVVQILFLIMKYLLFSVSLLLFYSCKESSFLDITGKLLGISLLADIDANNNYLKLLMKRMIEFLDKNKKEDMLSKSLTSLKYCKSNK